MNGDTMKDLPLIDLAQLERLNEWGGAGLQQKMIRLFLANSPERIDQIREGISTDSSEKAEAGAHTLKSSAGNIGAQRVQRLAQDAESLAEAGRLDELQALFPTLEEEFQAACGALTRLLEGGDH